jgi:dolichol-phosphate mannosyltransferase
MPYIDSETNQSNDLYFSEWESSDKERVMVVLPTYNESENLPLLVEKLFHLPIAGLRVLVIDDNSPDGTGDIAEELAKTFYKGKMGVIHRKGKLGLGTAYIAGFSFALSKGTDYIVQMDSDFSHNPSYLPSFLEALKTADVVVGSRYTKDGSLDPRWGIERRLLSKWASFYSRIILGLEVKDATTGFKMFRSEVLKQLLLKDLRSTGYCFLLEIAYLCQMCGFRIVEIPIHFQERHAGASKMSLRVSFEAAWKTWLIKFRY